MPPRSNPSPADVVAAFQRGGISEVLKLLLAAKGAGSKGKDHHLGGHFGGGVKPANDIAAPRKVDDLSPGEVPRASKDAWLLLAAALYVAHYFLTR